MLGAELQAGVRDREASKATESASVVTSVTSRRPCSVTTSFQSRGHVQL